MTSECPTSPVHSAHEVRRALQAEPSVDDERIGISLLDGVVTLTGSVSSHAERSIAERAVEHLPGVRAVANELEIRAPFESSDAKLAQSAAEALRSCAMVPADRIKVKVTKGLLTLDGEVSSEPQRRAAEESVRNLPHLRGIANSIFVHPEQEADPATVRAGSASRYLLLEARVLVDVSDGEVTLTGRVASAGERDEAERTAWDLPGVTTVHNAITVIEDR